MEAPRIGLCCVLTTDSGSECFLPDGLPFLVPSVVPTLFLGELVVFFLVGKRKHETTGIVNFFAEDRSP